jgi:hypothetical protein
VIDVDLRGYKMQNEKTERVSTKQVAKIIGVTLDSLQRAVFCEKFTPPEKNNSGRFIWTDNAINTARQYFTRRCG